jgi:hypothetical protein
MDSMAPVVEVVMAAPLASAAAPLTSWMEDEVSFVVAETARATVATTPLGMVWELSPHSTHVELPAELIQDSCLLAALAAEPATKVEDVMSAIEYFRVHWIPDGEVPVPLRAILNVTVAPGLPEPAERLRAATLWAP